MTTQIQSRASTLKKQLETAQEELLKAKKEQSLYSQKLLNDVEAAQRRLVLLAEGREGVSEFTDEQMQRTRLLADKTRTAQSRVNSLEIQIKEEEKNEVERIAIAQSKAVVEPLIKEFNEAVDRLTQAWSDIGVTANEYQISSYYVSQAVKIPPKIGIKEERGFYSDGRRIGLELVRISE